MPVLDYQTAFGLAPISQMLSRRRPVVDANRRALEIFDSTGELLSGRCLELLHCTRDEYGRTGQRIVASFGALLKLSAHLAR